MTFISVGIKLVRILLFEFIVALCVVGQELMALVIMCIGVHWEECGSVGGVVLIHMCIT